jgi:membrane-bound metal-dependent hydrolase YbcI (DUF457 family)
MKRNTHLLMGIAAAAPVAAMLSPAGAVGCLWLGMCGGALPDYLDFRSGIRRNLRHRGVSHAFITVALAGGFSWLVLDALSRSELRILPVPAGFVWPWTIALVLGVLSHVAGDACTRGGVQPWLPFWRKRMWLLPRLFRGRSDGWQNAVARFVSAGLIGMSLGVWLAR